jgi:hypothetical protein
MSDINREKLLRYLHARKLSKKLLYNLPQEGLNIVDNVLNDVITFINGMEETGDMYPPCIGCGLRPRDCTCFDD